MKKILAFALVLVLSLGLLTACNAPSTENSQPGTQPTETETGPFGYGDAKELAANGTSNAAAAEVTGDVAALKVGVILIGDENEGYTAAHINGIKDAAAALGMADAQFIWKYTIGENQGCYEAAVDLINSGCTAIFSNSYGHQTFMMQAATEYPNVQFIAMTGDQALSSGLSNLHNAFTAVYQSRYVSGVVAGMKLKELVDNGTLTAAAYPSSFDADGNIKIGYVGAFPYAEVVSGYTAFFLGVKSVISNVAMEVNYTTSWFDIIAEGNAAKAMLAKGCVIIGQHADSTGAPAAVQNAVKNEGKLAFSIGYNIDMMSVAPDAALTSAQNNWHVYYKYALTQLINGEAIATNWAAGYDADAVRISALNESIVAPGTAEKVAEVEAALKNGTLNVFDTSKFTVGGKTVTWAYATDSDGEFTNDCNNVIADGYYHESYVQSAPSFSLRIDGITEK